MLSVSAVKSFQIFFFERFIAKKICTACWRTSYKIVPLTNLNKFLYNGKCEIEVNVTHNVTHTHTPRAHTHTHHAHHTHTPRARTHHTQKHCLDRTQHFRTRNLVVHKVTAGCKRLNHAWLLTYRYSNWSGNSPVPLRNLTDFHDFIERYKNLYYCSDSRILVLNFFHA